MTPLRMTAADAVAILERLDAAGVWHRLDGGWGVDALLGEETRVHDDLDLVVRREDCEAVAAALPELERVAREWWPARFVLRRGAIQVDCHPLVLDGSGDGWQQLPDGSRGHYPASELEARGTIGGRKFACVSADLQLRHHLYHDPDDVDWHDVQALCRRFGFEVPELYGRRPGLLDPRRESARLPS
jgi:lincosamide nucleotidyltransferase A/C/D/E